MNFNVVKGRLVVLFAEIDPPAVSPQTIQRKRELSCPFSDLPDLLREPKEDAFNVRLAALCCAERRTIFVFRSQFA
jgi:hypothetical protein